MNKYTSYLQSIDRYKDFTFLSMPLTFVKLNTKLNEDIELVQLHCFNRDKLFNIGFCGSFSWKNNEVISLDGDVYTKNTLVYGYKFFTFDTDKTGLDIIVDEENW